MGKFPQPMNDLYFQRKILVSIYIEIRIPKAQNHFMRLPAEVTSNFFSI